LSIPGVEPLPGFQYNGAMENAAPRGRCVGWPIVPVVFFLILVAGCGGSAPRFNLVLIVSDALRGDITGCYGGPALTPNIDWLAEHGVLFERAYSPSPRTLPSAVAMLTAQHASAFPAETEKGHVIKYHVPEGEVLPAEIVRAAGYTLVQHVENSNASVSNNLQGFEAAPMFGTLTSAQIQSVRKNSGLILRGKAYRQLAGTLHFLLTVPDGQPFFAFKWILDPHSYYDPPSPFLERIAVDAGRLSRPIPFYSHAHFGYQWKKNRMFGPEMSEDELEYVKNLYIREVESVDERVGYLLNALRKRKLLDRTFVVFTADHGESFGEGGRYSHGHSYAAELLHVPLILVGPGLPAGKRLNHPVSLLALMPTLLELLRIDAGGREGQRDGFATLLEGGTVAAGPIYFDGVKSSTPFRDALIVDGYKLVAFRDGRPPRLLVAENDEAPPADRSPELARVMKKMLRDLLARRKGVQRRLGDRLARDRTLPGIDGEKRRKILENLRSLGYLD